MGWAEWPSWSRCLGDESSRRRAEDALDHEEDRLQRHGEDLRSLFAWIDERGEFAALVALSRKHSAIGEAARRATRWLINHPELVARLRLDDLDRRLERLSVR